MKIDKGEYERLVRNEMVLEILKELRQAELCGAFVADETYDLILGV